jgi:predicted nucleotidyltransferase
VLPDGSSAYLFGSASRADRYADVDLLILYDSSLCPAARAHAEHKALVDRVAEIAGVPVHLCLLSYRE